MDAIVESARPSPRLGLASDSDSHSRVLKDLRDHMKFHKELLSTPAAFVTAGNTDGDKVEGEDEFVKTIMPSLQATWLTNEYQLQFVVANAMNNLENVNVIVPEECRSDLTQKDKTIARFLSGFWSKIPQVFFTPKEKDTKSLLSLVAQNAPEDVFRSSLPRDMVPLERGLFVQSTSRPDTVATITTEYAGGEPSDIDVAFGEIKNADKYTTDDAQNQEACHMMILHYWYKAICGKDVEKVNGFYLCGPRCNDTKSRKRSYDSDGPKGSQYGIGLMELSAPSRLGSLHRLKCYQNVFDLTDDLGLRLLARFLRKSSLWNRLREAHVGQLQYPSPAWFLAPKGFQAKLDELRGQLSMMRNGTAAVVLKCRGMEGINGALELLDEGLQSRASKHWSRVRIEENQFMYLKVVTASATGKFYSETPLLRGDIQMELEDIYPAPAIAYDYRYAVLMNDCGESMKQWHQTRISFTIFDLQQKYSELWTRTRRIEAETCHYHGDIGEQNLVVDSTDTFKVIDWDESATTPHPRDPGNNAEGRLLHPDTIRMELDTRDVYSEVQLAVLYFRLKCIYVEGKEFKAEEYKVMDQDEKDVMAPYRNLVNLPRGMQGPKSGLILKCARDLIAAAKTELGLL